MDSDFRSDPMDSPEGKGKAKKAWDAYAKTVNRAIDPIVKPGAEVAARAVVEDLLGFWLLWHLYGGFEGLEELGMHKSTIWRKIKRFRVMTGEHPDVYAMPGVTIDPKAYWASSKKKVGPRPKK